jgi:hypothetical protein
MFNQRTRLAVGKRQVAAGHITPAVRTPPPRRKEGAHPGRISTMRNTETPTRSQRICMGRPTVRKADRLSGNRNVQQANAGKSKDNGKPVHKTAFSSGGIG